MLMIGRMPLLLERLGTPEPGFILCFDGGEESWGTKKASMITGDIERAGDMPRK